MDVTIFLDFPKEEKKIVQDAKTFSNVRKAASEFCSGWKLGSCFVFVRSRNAGLVAQWLESWYPLDGTTTEYALVLEDDLQLSPLYFTWLKRALRKYRGSDEARGKYKNMCGITLQKAEVVAIRRWAKFNEAWNMKRHFGYQQPGSWGQLFFPECWRAFREYRENTQDAPCCTKYVIPKSPNMNGPTKQPDAWTEFFLHFLWTHGKYILTPSIKNPFTLSLNHLEKGVHYPSKGKVWQKVLTSKDQSPQMFNFPTDLDLYSCWGAKISSEEGLVRPQAN